MQLVLETLASCAIVVSFVAAIAFCGYLAWRKFQSKSLGDIVRRYLAPLKIEQLSITERQFPGQIRADLQRALDTFLAQVKTHSFIGVTNDFPGLGADFASLFEANVAGIGALKAAPPQYEQVDIGEAEPIMVLKSGLWLLERSGVKFAILLSGELERTECGAMPKMKVQVATSRSEAGEVVARELFRHLEQLVERAECYRGKVLSLECGDAYSGQASGVKVHRLGQLSREQVILPQQTIDLLDRNVVRFAQRRPELQRLRMAVKKGLLFYGPPGTGKTHTVRYLAGSLPGHTTLLIAAEQVALLSQYLTLARLLQPSIVVIEDVDLIARERSKIGDVRSEVLLNKLLNEMDGLKEDCAILFILTTNRPEQLEQALASRPGRIDQAIEFPLPDEAGRSKLIRLYAREIVVPDEIVEHVVRKTEKVSASFIKELMRRATQFHLEANGTSTLTLADIDQALEEMLFSGGSLNLKLLGAEGRLDA